LAIFPIKESVLQAIADRPIEPAAAAWIQRSEFGEPIVTMAILEVLQQQAKELQLQLAAWRRDFHQHPELGFHEFRTAGIVAEHLATLGIEATTGVGGTGVVGVIEADGLPEDAPTVLLRFDMDALPIVEQTGLPFASVNPGVMHACGHDGHTAIGMGVATLLSRHRNGLAGRVKLVFQPAEEGLGGARAMIEDGVMDAPVPQAVFGLHLWSRLPLDQVVVQAGPLWAAADIVNLTVHGVSGHGAVPQETVDATLVAAQIVVAWQSIVSRSVDPLQSAVVTVGMLHSGSASNIISGRAELSCSIRSLEEDVRDLLVRRMGEIADGICAAFGATCELDFRPGVPVTSNSQAGTELMRRVAGRVVGEANLTTIPPMMVGEDMSEFLNRAPGCFVLVGASDPGGPLHAPHHSDKFDFDERMLPTGVALLSGAAVTWLEANGGELVSGKS
jgi:amidohydrolase